MEIGELIAMLEQAIFGHTAGHLSLTSQTVATAPPNRDRKTIGVGEKVVVTAVGATGSCTWSVSGLSTLSSTSGSSVTLTAYQFAETATLTATDTCNCTVSIGFQVIEPTSVMMERVPGSGVAHAQGAPTVGMRLNIYIGPDNVSFENITVVEEDCVSVCTGYFVGTPVDGIHHAGHGAGNPASVGPPVAGKGSKVAATDTAQGTANFGTPYTDGTFDWPIPWVYSVGGGTGKEFAIVHQRFIVDSSGTLTVTKGGATASAALNDPPGRY